MDNRQVLLQEIVDLEAKLAELKKRLPAHSIPPALVAELDELDEQLEQARGQLEQLERSSKK